MKKLLFLFVLFLLPVSVLFAQVGVDDPAPEQIDIQQLLQKQDEDAVSKLIISQPLFENKIYNKGESVQVSTKIKNLNNYDYTDLKINSRISVFTEGFGIRDYAYQTKLVSFFLARNSEKNLNFSFQLPQSINFDKNDLVRLELEVMTEQGLVVAVTSSEIKLGDFIPTVEIESVYLNVGDLLFSLQEGPTVSTTTSPNLTIKLKNNSKGEVELSPFIVINDT